VSDYQLRSYRVKPGAMDEFVALWRDHIVPARLAHGFTIDGAWHEPRGSRFVWVVGHEDFAAANDRYYASPERAAVPRDPLELLDEVETTMLAAVPR
jgi:antibiotic biosynthesis monooxygenase (ABM) superfamily enzyme